MAGRLRLLSCGTIDRLAQLPSCHLEGTRLYTWRGTRKLRPMLVAHRAHSDVNPPWSVQPTRSYAWLHSTSTAHGQEPALSLPYILPTLWKIGPQDQGPQTKQGRTMHTHKMMPKPNRKTHTHQSNPKTRPIQTKIPRAVSSHNTEWRPLPTWTWD